MALVLTPSNPTATATSKELAFDNEDACMNVFFRFVDGKVRCVWYYICLAFSTSPVLHCSAPSAAQHIEVQKCAMRFDSIRFDEVTYTYFPLTISVILICILSDLLPLARSFGQYCQHETGRRGSPAHHGTCAQSPRCRQGHLFRLERQALDGSSTLYRLYWSTGRKKE
jgi:hypothetical protein